MNTYKNRWLYNMIPLLKKSSPELSAEELKAEAERLFDFATELGQKMREEQGQYCMFRDLEKDRYCREDLNHKGDHDCRHPWEKM